MSCSKPNFLKGIESKKIIREKSKLKVVKCQEYSINKNKRTEVELMEKPKENESKGKKVEKININDNEVVLDIFKVHDPLINSNV